MKKPVLDINPDELARHSRFVAEAWRRFEDAPPPHRPVEPPDRERLAADPQSALRRYRQLQSIHILWQELAGETGIQATGQALSALAAECLELALEVAEGRVGERHGYLEDPDGHRARLVVFGLGKLGGDELNFNSDIDLVFAHDASGRSTGPRRIEAAEWMKRVARELIDLMDSVTAHGRVWIVDTRLRPFGESGALVWSIAAMEQYFLSEGRTWERYAWLKAAAVAGDCKTGQQLIEALRPFIYRRYLDYGIFESLRELHQRIDANSRARARHDDIKRGRGGIRELEFLVQSLQILRGGHDKRLRQTGFLPALEACEALGLIPSDETKSLHDAYSYLRILENRLQAVSGRQGHDLPQRADERASLARMMGEDGWQSLSDTLDTHRRLVRQHFSERFREPESETLGTTEPLWPPSEGLEKGLAEAGFEHPDAAAASLRDLHRSLSRRALSAVGQRRLERLMPRLIEEIATHQPPDTGVDDLLRLIDQISRRSAYLALLYERPETLVRLVRVFRVSARVAEWIIASPQLLDDLLDPVHGFELPAAPTPDPEDREASLFALGRWRQAGFLRTALTELDQKLAAPAGARQLSYMAGVIVDQVLTLVGDGQGDLAVIGYGNLGAEQLHYESDLDLVFLHRDGETPLRSVQRLISALQMPLPGGKLFEIDTRLRPNGRAGLLVSRIESFDDYQHNKAWIWEHQALIRARWVAGSRKLEAEFDRIRTRVLCRPRDSSEVAAELARMRRRQHRERAEPPLKRLLIDLQFIAELGVLCCAEERPELATRRDTPSQLEALAEAGWIERQQSESLIALWRELLTHRHLDWLQREPGAFSIAQAQDRIGKAWERYFPASGDEAT